MKTPVLPQPSCSSRLDVDGPPANQPKARLADGHSRRVALLASTVGFWGFIGAALAVTAWFCLAPRVRIFESSSAESIREIAPGVFEAKFGRSLPSGCQVASSGVYLTNAPTAGDVVEGAARAWIDPHTGVVRWSPSADASRGESLPVVSLSTNGRWPMVMRRLWLILIPLAGGLLACGCIAAELNRGDVLRLIDWRVPTPNTARWTLVALTGLFLGLALVPGWNRLVTCPDTRSYVNHSPMRTPLAPAWLDLFDSRDPGDRSQALPASGGVVNHWGAGHRFVNAIRGGKLLLVAALCYFAWTLAGVVPWWMAGATMLAAVAYDASLGMWSRGMVGHVDVILSEGLSYGLIVLTLGILAGYLQSPSLWRGVALAGCVNLLLLARPASLPFVSVYGIIWLFHLRRDGLLIATRRAALFAAIVVAGVFLHCTTNYARHGRFEQHAFTGMNLVTTALQPLTPEDANAFTDPQIRDYVSRCATKLAAMRKTPFDGEAANINCWVIAVPTFHEVFGRTVDEAPYLADDVLRQVARTLISRHRREFIELAIANFRRGFWTFWQHVPLLLVIVHGSWSFRRTGDQRRLFLVFLAALPFLCVMPACATNYPIDRYRSATYFAELCTAPLYLMMLVALNRRGA